MTNDTNTTAPESAYRLTMRATCPHCSALQNILDGTDTRGEVAKAGDLSFCPECGRFAVILNPKSGKLGLPKAKDHRFIARDSVCQDLLHRYRMLRHLAGTQ